MVPLSSLDDAGIMNLINMHGNPEISVRLQAPGTENFTLRSMEDVLACRAKSTHLLEKNHDALMQYVDDIKNLRALILTDLAAKDGKTPEGNTGQSL